MTSQSALELLFPELQQRILSQLDSFKSLYALIRASPRLHQVFRLNKKAILSNVACRRFDDATIRAALGIERLCQIEDPPFSRDTVLQYFSPAFDELNDYHKLTLPLPVSTKLAKLDGTLQFFTNDYVQNTLPIVADLNKLERPAIKTMYKSDCEAPRPTISRSESDRLRRAFCQFETYRQLFGRFASNFNLDPQRHLSESSLSIFEQAENFFGHMPAYQATEVACIRDYLHRRLRGLFDQVEDYFVQELQAGCPNPRDIQQARDWYYDINGGRHDFLIYDEHYFGYNGKNCQQAHLEHLSSLGLPYIRRLLESAGDERQDLLLRNEVSDWNDDDRGFLTAALGLDSLYWNDEIYGWYDRDIESCLDKETRSDLPPGWLWAHSNNHYRGVVDTHSKGLRDWGYVFWDLERLQRVGILNLDPYEVGKTEFDDYLANQGPSVQERWLGPQSSLPEDEEEASEGEEREVPEYEENDGVCGDQLGGQKGEDTQGKDRSCTLFHGLSLVRRWLRYNWQKWWKPCGAKKMQDKDASCGPSMGLSSLRRWLRACWQRWWKPCQA